MGSRMPKVPRPDVLNPVWYTNDISLHDKHWEALLKMSGLCPGQEAEVRAGKPNATPQVKRLSSSPH